MLAPVCSQLHVILSIALLTALLVYDLCASIIMIHHFCLISQLNQGEGGLAVSLGLLLRLHLILFQTFPSAHTGPDHPPKSIGKDVIVFRILNARSCASILDCVGIWTRRTKKNL